jgi:methylaspartate mutase sigma subunit
MATKTCCCAAPRAELAVVVAGTPSDSHTWNLLYLQLLLAELGHRVTNLGPCVPARLMVDTCRRVRPDLVVLSSVNGHGCHDGRAVVRAIRARAELAATPVVIGGKLSTTEALDGRAQRALLDAGFDAVFADDDLDSFFLFVETVALRHTNHPGRTPCPDHIGRPGGTAERTPGRTRLPSRAGR